MLSYIRKISCLNNLYRAHPVGQISTLLILIMMSVLVFILITVNLGNLSVKTTKLSNAADSAALLLASQLSTKANVLNETLKRTKGAKYSASPPKACSRGAGLLGAILAVVMVILFIVCPPAGTLAAIGTSLGASAAYATIAGAAVVGAVGGAIGSGITTGTMTGALMGAVQGAAIGAAMGWAAGGAGSVTAGGATSSATFLPFTEVTVGSPVLISTGEGLITGTIATAPSVAAEAGLTALVAGASIYQANVQQEMKAQGFYQASKSLKSLPEYDQYRESVFLQVLSQVVSDPNRIVDVGDINGNGYKTDKIAAFEKWWYDRVTILKWVTLATYFATDGFVTSGLSVFSSFAAGMLQESLGTFTEILSHAGDGNIQTTANSLTGFLSREEIEGQDGPLVELLRVLENAPAKYDISFWEPGPSKQQLLIYNRDDPETCQGCTGGDEDGPVIPGYDEVDRDVTTLLNFITISKSVELQRPDFLTSTWHSWLPIFYEEDTINSDGTTQQNRNDYYDRFGVMIYGDDQYKGIKKWKEEIEAVRVKLPLCQWDEVKGEFTNAPCRGFDNPPLVCAGQRLDQTFGTIDKDLIDEFKEVQDDLDLLIDSVQEFRDYCRKLDQDIQEAYAPLISAYGGINSVTYRWTDLSGANNDVQNQHAVTVGVSLFKLAHIEVEEGNSIMGKVCLVLKDYTDESGMNTWVSVTETLPGGEMRSTQNAGAVPLGIWNRGVTKVSRTARASYTYIPQVGDVIIGITSK